jgi:16S rRNA (uracil1498-N3)-methyltransferase
MQLFYAPDITPPLYTLSEEESKHCIKVLRLGLGDKLHITDGRGNLFECRVSVADARRCTVEVVNTISEFEKMTYGLTMAVAPTKNIERFEWFLEKATEVGVTRFVPIVCDHSERRIIKHDRELRVITSAIKQSLKAYHPTLDDLTPLRQLIAEPFDGQKFIAHCDSSFDGEEFKRLYLPSIIKKSENILILIGPEGDFSPEEIKFALANGFQPITLGEQRLRTETAAVVATVMVNVCNKI